MAREKKETGENQKEIQFRRSLLRFSLVFIIVSCAGLLTRLVVNRYPLEAKLREAVKIPEPYLFTLNKPTLRFSSGWLPVVGVHIQSVELQEKICPANKLFLQDTLAVISPLSLLGGRPELSEVIVESLQVSHAKVCGKVTPSGSQTAEKNDSLVSSLAEDKKSIVSKNNLFIDKFWTQFFEKDLKKINELPIGKITVERFKFNLIESLENEIAIEGRGTLRFADGAQLKADLKKILFRQKQVDFLSNRIEARVNTASVELDWKGSVREGAFGFTVKVENSKSFPSQIGLQLSKMPVSAAIDLFDDRLDINYLWASCHMRLASLWESIEKTPVETKNCKLEGPYGEVQATGMEWSLNHLNKLKLELKSLNLDEIVKDRRGLFLSGILEKYGILSGEVNIVGSDVDGHGFLEDSEIVFSNNNFRDIQKVSKIPFSFKRLQENWQAEIRDVEIEEGDFAGEILIQRNKQGQTDGRLAFHKLKLSPRIYKLMLHAEASEFKLYGSFNYDQHHLKDWSALLATPELKSEKYQFKNLKVKGQKKDDENSEVRVTVSQGQIDPDARLVEWLRPTHLDQEWSTGKPVSFRELSTRIEVHKDRSLTWKRGYARLLNGWQISSEGQRDLSRNVNAWLQWDSPDGRFMKWDFEGAFFEGIWKPDTAWVQAWLEKNSDFMEKFKRVRLEGASELGLRQKAIEKVKDVIRGVRKEEK